MNMPYFLGLDQGTTGTTAILLNQNLQMVSKSTVPIQSFFPKPNWVEQDPQQILKSVYQAISQCISGFSSPISLGITNQRESFLLFDQKGNPKTPVISWQCKRSQKFCEDLKLKNLENTIQQKTGLRLDPYFSATKLAFVFQENPHLLKEAQEGNLLFGTLDTFLLYHLSGFKIHATDATNASRTLFYNIHSLDYDDELLYLFQIPKACLPSIFNSCGEYGRANSLNLPINALIGDQQAALLGQGGLSFGDSKITLGTGAFLMAHTGDKPLLSEKGLLTTLALKLAEKTTYCLEGSAFVAGDALNWVIETLGLFQSPQDLEHHAAQVKDTQVLFIPTLLGLGAPYWKPQARGAFLGLSKSTKKTHLALAILQGLAYQNHILLKAAQEEGLSLTQLRLDGGLSQSNILMQFQADLSQILCARFHSPEATAMGAATLAAYQHQGIALELLKNQPSSLFYPQQKPPILQAYEEAYRTFLN